MSDLQDFKEGIKELYETIGTSDVLFYPLDTTTVEENIYNEFVSPKQYLEPIPLTGLVSWSNTTDMLNTGNSIVVPCLNVTVAYLSLEEHNLVDIPTLEQGKVKFQGKEYQVFEVTPKAFFLGEYKSYVLHCKRVI